MRSRAPIGLTGLQRCTSLITTIVPHTLRFVPLTALLALLLSPLTAAADGGVSVAAVGDVMMGSDFPEKRLPEDGGTALLVHAAPFFRRCDIAMANLEGPLALGGTPAKAAVSGRSYLFRTPPSYATNLKNAGLSLVSLANNHALDFGSRGLRSTKAALVKAGVAFSSKSGEIAEFTVRGVRVGVIALSFGAPPRSIVYPEQALSEVARAAGRYDILILTVHAGAEGRRALHVVPGMEYFLGERRGDLIRFAHDAIDRGADLVIAQGPHVPRALELYQGRLIAYSLGNFATYGGINVERESGYAPLLTLELADDGAFRSGAVISFLQKPFSGPRPDPAGRALKLMRRLSAADFPDSPLTFAPTGEIGVGR